MFWTVGIFAYVINKIGKSFFESFLKIVKITSIDLIIKGIIIEEINNKKLKYKEDIARIGRYMD